MELYVARQPIFDRNKSVAGYELLHRGSEKLNEYSETDGEYASARVITAAFLTMGQDWLTGGKPAFINFPADLLISGVAYLLPKDQLVVEIPETVAPTTEIVNACSLLKTKGYKLALDDYVLNPAFDTLAAMADYVKVDFRQSSFAEQCRVLKMHKGKNIQFVAEKVETEEEFVKASEAGYSLFQGYFFSRPVILNQTALLAGKLGYIRLMQAINASNPDFRAIISAIESDVTLSLEAIRLSNSAVYGRRQKISSIRQAVVVLGLEGVRRWIYLSSLRRLGMGKPDALVSTSVIRSRFMEQLAEALGQRLKRPEYSMLGLFSLLDALTGCPLDELLQPLNIDEDIKHILLGGNTETPIGAAFSMMLAYERGEWEKAGSLAKSLCLALDTVAYAYVSSLKWYHEFLRVSMG